MFSLLAVFVGGSASAQDVRPARPDARCLSQIVTSRGGTLDVLNPTSVGEATAIYDEYWTRTVELGKAEEEVFNTVTAALASMKDAEADGSAPPGSAEVERERYIAATLRSVSTLDLRRQQFPVCQWPQINGERLSDRIRAIQIGE